MGDEAVDDLDRLLRLVDCDVHMHAEDQLAPGDVLQLVDEVSVAVARRDALALEQRKRMRACRADAHALPARDFGHVCADFPQLLLDVGRRATHGRCDLEHRLHQLGVDSGLELVAADGCEDRVDVLDEVERLAVEQHVLLLDAERVCVALAEGVVEHAAAGREARALARYGCWIDLLHRSAGSIASASISTSQRASSSSATIAVVAGRAAAKASAWARPTSSIRSARVR